eukprot:gene2381-2685_t
MEVIIMDSVRVSRAIKAQLEVKIARKNRKKKKKKKKKNKNKKKKKKRNNNKRKNRRKKNWSQRQKKEKMMMTNEAPYSSTLSLLHTPLLQHHEPEEEVSEASPGNLLAIAGAAEGAQLYMQNSALILQPQTVNATCLYQFEVLSRTGFLLPRDPPPPSSASGFAQHTKMITVFGVASAMLAIAICVMGVQLYGRMRSQVCVAQVSTT